MTDEQKMVDKAEVIHELSVWLTGTATNFNALLFTLIAKADPVRKAELRAAFPLFVEVYDDWQASMDPDKFLAGGRQAEPAPACAEADIDLLLLKSKMREFLTETHAVNSITRNELAHMREKLAWLEGELQALKTEATPK